MKGGDHQDDVRVTESSRMTLPPFGRRKKAKQMQRKPVSHSPLIGLDSLRDSDWHLGRFADTAARTHLT